MRRIAFSAERLSRGGGRAGCRRGTSC
jgi:hypothetical protein